ncbi:hypothetical protein AB1Y20_005433 [Prymnesium parvum]|uniref:Roadblock/LAMTOR2 domain-containing protein n=1 Tax=Prymnesium parvum TaxID=97485 RepID=A0AB34J793_PRYPA
MERHHTLEDVRGATPRGFHLEESSGRSGGGPLSPANPLGQSMQSNGHSTVGEDIDVSTEGLIDETMERLGFVHGVQGVLIIDRDGIVVRSTMANDAARYAAHMLPLLERAKLCTEAVEGPKGRFQMLCVRTRKHEMLMCTEKDMLFSILIIQDPNVESIPAVLQVESR